MYLNVCLHVLYLTLLDYFFIFWFNFKGDEKKCITEMKAILCCVFEFD